MKKNEYLAELKSELKKNNASDIDDIMLEYEQHFAFKMADGYSEEEIAAKLGTPKTIAAQFDSAIGVGKKQTGGGFFLKLGLGFTSIFEAMFYILFLAWDAVLAAATLAFTTLGVFLIGDFNFEELIPYMPYRGAVVLCASIIGLAAIFGVSAVYCF